MKKSSTKPIKGVPLGEPSSNLNFRLQAKTFFLTYSGISEKTGQKITKENLTEFFLKNNPLDRKVRPEKYLVCQQMYDSGQPHFHVILGYPRRKVILHQAHFDFLGIHPNIQSMLSLIHI